MTNLLSKRGKPLGFSCNLLFLLFLCCVIVTTTFQCKKPSLENTFSNNSTIERAKKWFSEEWKKSAPPDSRISPWLHDTSFIFNNYTNIILDWRYARVVNQGGYTYTEVPASLPDDLQFKNGPPNEDTTAFLNLMTDSVYRNLNQSKLFWVLREAPGQDPIAEIVTFVGDYDYAKDNYLRFINGICYFDFADYSGIVLYHDRFGGLIRLLQYLRGNITNTIRCGMEGGLDPAPGNRVHLDVCLEILTFERDCITTYTEEGIGEKYCSEWFLVGAKMVGNCWSSGGGGGSSNYTPYKPSENGLDCATFQFTQTADNWQEAGVKNSRVNLFWIGGQRSGEYIPVTIKAPIIIGLPLQYSAGKAANLAAKACSFAEDEVARLLKGSRIKPEENLIDKTYRDAVESFIRKFGGRSGRVRSNMPFIIINDAEYKLFGNGDCD